MKSVSIYSLADSKGFIRYIGKTTDLQYRFKQHLKESANKKTHKERWIRSLLDRNEEPIIEEIDIVPEKEWQFWERFYITLFKSWGFALTNGTEGGDGVSIGTPAPNRKKILQYTLDGNFIQEWDSIADAQKKLKIIGISNACRNSKKHKQYRHAGGYMWRYKTKTIKKKISPCDMSISARPILQYSLSGEFLREWKSGRQVKEFLGIRHIGCVCNGKRKHAGGYIWKYKTNDYSKELGISIIVRNQPKRILQYNLNGDFIKEWNSILAATKATKLKHIAEACSGKHKVIGGYVWKYKIDNNIPLKIQPINDTTSIPKPVIQMTLTGNILNVWNSRHEAEMNTGIKNINKALRGLRKHAGGFLWKDKEG
jgi:hypothetical protein